MGLVRGIDADPVKRALTASLVSFAPDIGSTLVAEGIETAAELRALVDLGVPWGQGYLLGPPADIASMSSASATHTLRIVPSPSMDVSSTSPGWR
jgi:EAL domain-containing protein (putative c-di-GMP-specific phosphodiesterase class I)